MRKKLERGSSLAEVVVVATIATVFLAAIVGVYNLHMKIIFASSRNVKATFLAEETIEAVKYLRNTNWTQNISALSTGSDYYLSWESGKWASSLSNAYIDGLYERKFVLSSVSRDSSSNIVTSGGTNDPKTRLLTATVSWREGSATSTRVLKTYITNIFNN